MSLEHRTSAPDFPPRARVKEAAMAVHDSDREELRAAYDAALSSYDVLIMPRVPMRATELLSPTPGVS